MMEEMGDANPLSMMMNMANGGEDADPDSMDEDLILSLIHISALLERSPFELSGGQKRRVAVAGVMAMKPRILVLDEPCLLYTSRCV